MQGTRWVFTYNNYSEEDVARLTDIGGNLDRHGLSYLVWGREVGESGTPHLQGYCIFLVRKRLGSLRSLIGPRGHYAVSRGTPEQASDYCKKEGNFVEFGSLPKRRRAANVTDFCDWLRGLESFPSERQIANAFPGLWIRYQSKLTDLATHIVPVVPLEQGEPNEWQRQLEVELNEAPDDRSIRFIVDEAGGTGKSWFCRYMLTKNEFVQVLSVGKRDDLAFAIDITKKVFLFNVPRGGMEYMQYTILEQLKDRVVFSPKYWSQCKVLLNKVHVVVFCNEYPDLEKMTGDRYRTTTV